MKLEAAQRLTASTSEDEQLNSFVESLSEDQRQYFFKGLPVALHEWYLGNYEQWLRARETTVLEAALGKQPFVRMINAMAHLRQIFKPTIRGKIYRLTAMHEGILPKDRTEGTLEFKGIDQFRALTSWTTESNPEVSDREVPQYTEDVILEHDLTNSKIVLFDYLSMEELIGSVRKQKAQWEKLYSTKLDFWERFDRIFKEFLFEKEVALFLNVAQSIECTWRLV